MLVMLADTGERYLSTRTPPSPDLTCLPLLPNPDAASARTGDLVVNSHTSTPHVQFPVGSSILALGLQPSSTMAEHSHALPRTAKHSHTELRTAIPSHSNSWHVPYARSSV